MYQGWRDSLAMSVCGRFDSDQLHDYSSIGELSTLIYINMKCKNIECENETIGKRIYCSLTCRNVFVNKYLRNYDKVSDTSKQKKKEKEDVYLLNPKLCKQCGEFIPFDKKRNNFCGHSCLAKYSNPTRNVTWGNKISNSIHKYLISNGIREIGKVGLYDIICKGCGEVFTKKRNDIRYCTSQCRRNFKRKNMDGYQRYRQDTNFKFSLNDYPDEFDFSLIEKYGWYSPSNKKNNLDGVSRDHLISVREGYELGIDPNLLSHPANCRLIKHTDNISKNSKSIITIDELLERIKIFEIKYGKYGNII